MLKISSPQPAAAPDVAAMVAVIAAMVTVIVTMVAGSEVTVAGKNAVTTVVKRAAVMALSGHGLCAGRSRALSG